MITSLDQLDLSKTYSFEDYSLWKFKERVELFWGKIKKMSPAPSSDHQRISYNLTGTLFNIFRKSNKLCSVFTSPFDVRLEKEGIIHVVQPDLCIICDPNKIDKRGCNGAPDFIIEILSPGNASHDMKFKYQIYEQNGILEYWIVDPERYNIHQYVAEKDNFKFELQKIYFEDEIICSTIFENVKIEINDIFYGISNESDNQ